MPYMKKVSLRILYTINNSPQYILARSQAPVPVSPVFHSPDKSDSNTLYATVNLKACLEIIARSSPELAQDTSRDFSVYVLDPLESNSAPAPVQISNTTNGEVTTNTNCGGAEQPRGVAVGFGLMSLALQSPEEDTTLVVGTLVRQGSPLEALEVIFALREFSGVKNPAWGVLATHIPKSNPHPISSFGSSTSHSNATVTAVTSSHIASSAYQTTLHIPSSSSTIPLPSGATETSSNSVSTLASIERRTATGKAKVKPRKTVTSKPSTIPLTESDKLFYTAETYIGGPKKKGRPKSTHKSWAPTDGNSVASSSSSDHHEDVIVIDGSNISNGNAPSVPRSDDRTSSIVQRHSDQSGSSSKPSISQSKPKPKKKRPAPDPSIPPFSTAPLVRRPQEPHIFPTPSQPKAEPKAETQKDITLLDVLALLSATSPADPGSQNAAILAALNSIDSSCKLNDHQVEEPNPALISALKQLLSICSKPLSGSEEFPSPLSNDQTPQPISSQEDEIVVLDKENVNPSVFRRRAQRDYEEAKLRGSPPSVGPSLGIPFATAGQAERQAQGPRLSSRSNENSPSKPVLTPSALSGGAPELGRKRTLSDFLNEKDSGRNRSKARERERAERRDAHRHAKSQRQQTSTTNSSRHYSRLVEQPRPEQSSTSYYRTGLEPWTSPRSWLVENTEKMSDSWESEVETALPHPFRALASPESHRISASSPVRSNSVHLQARKKYVVPAWARTSTATQPRLSEEARRAMQRAEQERREKLNSRKKAASLNARQRTKTVVSKTNPKSCAAPTSEKSTSHVEPVIVAATSNYPLVAAAGILPLHSSFSSKASSPPPDPPPFPKTPTRERTNRVTSGGLADSLFTPISRSDSLFGSARTPLFSPKTVFGTCPSPLSNRKVAKRSPSGPLKKQHLATPNAEQVLQGSKFLGKDNQDKVVLSWDLEGAFEELQCPPNSQPLTSSDVDVEEAIAPANKYVNEKKDPDTEDANDSDNVGVRQHWEGLPPSSPPPPTSPALMSQDLEDEDMEVLELPFPTSDIDADGSSPDAEFAALNEDPPAFSEEEFAACLANGDFSAFFSDDQDLGKDISSGVDVFDQFTNLNAPSDQSEGKQAPIMNMNLEEMDFTEFWKTLKPLVEENVGMDFSSEVGDMKTLDHAKLADDMQALLSGCLM